jgi:hemoglobin
LHFKAHAATLKMQFKYIFMGCRNMLTHPDTPDITDQDIHDLVHGFYDHIRQHPDLAPIFAAAIKDEQWPVHLTKMCDFWSSIMQHSGRYKGNPMAAHLTLEGLKPAHFRQWLDLFKTVAHDILPPAKANAFYLRADRIAHALQANLDSIQRFPIPAHGTA